MAAPIARSTPTPATVAVAVPAPASRKSSAPSAPRTTTVTAERHQPGHATRRAAAISSARGRGSAASRSAESAKPIAASRQPTATMWAQNQVLPMAAAYQRTVPRPRNNAVSRRTSCRIGR